MIAVFLIAVFWIVYGILGLFGIQNIPEKYRNSECEKDYKRFCGIGWLLLGVSVLSLWFVKRAEVLEPPIFWVAFVLCVLPAILHEIVGECRFRKKIKKTDD